MQPEPARLLLADDDNIDTFEVRMSHFTCGAPRQVRSGHRGRRGVCAQEKVKTGYFPIWGSSGCGAVRGVLGLTLNVKTPSETSSFLSKALVLVGQLRAAER